MQAIEERRQVKLNHGLVLRRHGGMLYIGLPSGRELAYMRPRIEEEGITYEGVEQTTRKWQRLATWGGKLTENIVQAVARDCLAEAMLRLDQAGYRTVMHVHDEVVLEAPRGEHTPEEVAELMGRPIPWAPGLPLRADAYQCDYYRKD